MLFSSTDFILKGSLWEDIELFLKEIKTPFIKQQVFIFKMNRIFMGWFNLFETYSNKALERILSIDYLSPKRIMQTFQNELDEIEKQGKQDLKDLLHVIQSIFSFTLKKRRKCEHGHEQTWEILPLQHTLDVFVYFHI